MTQREKDTMAREVAEYFENAADRKDITIIDPEGDNAPPVGSITEETRLDSYHAVQPDAAIRRQLILDILTGSEGMTAQEIADELHRRGITPFEERNFAAPRLTELKAAGKIEVTGKKQCYRTGRSVAVWAVKKGV